MRVRARRLSVVAGAAAIGASSPAWAHTGTGLAGGFVSGFAHPLSGPDHMLAMVSVGLWGSFLDRPLVYLLPITFPLVMVFGASLGMVGAPMVPVEFGIALSVIVLGVCIAASFRAPVPLAAVIVGAFAIFHGFAHGRELPSAADPAGYSLGFVLATGLLHIGGIAFGMVADFRHGRTAIRLAGGMVAMIGTAFLASNLSR